MKTETLSYLKQNAASLDLDEPMCITQHGKPTYVIESFEANQRRNQAIAMLKMINMGESDLREGRTSTSEELKSSLAERRKKALANRG